MCLKLFNVVIILIKIIAYIMAILQSSLFTHSYFVYICGHMVYLLVPTRLVTYHPTTSSPTAMPTLTPGYDLSITFDTVGTHTYPVKSTATELLVEACGASGGSVTSFVGGKGGCIQTVIDVTPSETLTIHVGGTGDNGMAYMKANGGINGGGVNIF